MNSNIRKKLKSIFFILFLKNKSSRSIINFITLYMNTWQHLSLFRSLGHIYWKYNARCHSGNWRVRFEEKEILFPIRADSFGLDWYLALSVLGYDLPLKKTFRVLLKRDPTFDMLIDVGANYGTQAVLFLAHGIEVIAFEPNPHCLEYFELTCNINGFSPTLENVALGVIATEVNLSFPEDETWLGSVVETQKDHLEKYHPLLSTIKVKQKRLDDYLERFRGRRILLKIDAEGNELGIIKGATQVLAESRPYLIFECWSDREEIFNVLKEQSYIIFSVPLNSINNRSSSTGLSYEQFKDHLADDFVAIPREYCTA